MKSLIFAFAIAAASSTAHSTSTFSEVKKVVFENTQAASEKDETVKSEMAVYEKGKLPHYEVTSSKFIVNGVNQLMNRAQSTLKDTNDYYPRLEKLVHSNGVCFSGLWTITEANLYTGYFKAGSKGLFIGRASTALSETERGDPRGFGFAGKIFPTLDSESKVATANFFLVDVLMGTQRNRYMDVKLTNSPSLGFRASVLSMALKIKKSFSAVDSSPMYRPLYPISELGMNVGEKIITPKYLMIETDKSNPRNDDTDFRDELSLKKNHVNGLRFNILVNDVIDDQGSSAWKKIGFIEAQDSTVSYGCDRRLHFQHPKLK